MNSRWVRALPLLLSSSVLLIAAAYAFFQGKNGTASIASFAAGLVLLGAWSTTAVVDWYEGHPQELNEQGSEEPHGDDAVGGVRGDGLRDGGDGVGDLPADVDGRAAGDKGERDRW